MTNFEELIKENPGMSQPQILGLWAKIMESLFLKTVEATEEKCTTKLDRRLTNLKNMPLVYSYNYGDFDNFNTFYIVADDLLDAVLKLNATYGSKAQLRKVTNIQVLGFADITASSLKRFEESTNINKDRS